MFSVDPASVPLCEGLTRREWLRVGGLAAAGLTLPDLLLARQAGAAQPRGSFGRARSCIVAFLFGAPGHQDLWDLKPEAPAEVRGEFRPIETAVPGIRICEHLPLVARVARHYSIVRSVSHPDDTHTVAIKPKDAARQLSPIDTSTYAGKRSASLPASGIVTASTIPAGSNSRPAREGG